MDDLGNFYKPARTSSTHLAVSWKGTVRYILPMDRNAQRACLSLFKPGRVEPFLRLQTAFPVITGAVPSVESENLAWIRSLLPSDALLSCSRRGAAGPWSKDTILLLSKEMEPKYVVKAGKGPAIAKLLENEAGWLKRLGQNRNLMMHVPRLLGYDQNPSGISFLAQEVLEGEMSFELGQPHFAYLNVLQATSHQSRRYSESQFARTIASRLDDVESLLPTEWAIRLRKASYAVERLFGDSNMPYVIGHNDFTPWNVRLAAGRAYVFDWEYGEPESLPLLDPLHFALKPLALRVAPRK